MSSDNRRGVTTSGEDPIDTKAIPSRRGNADGGVKNSDREGPLSKERDNFIPEVLGLPGVKKTEESK